MEKVIGGDCLVIFYKDPCPYCKTMKGVIEKFGARHPSVKQIQINGLENEQSTRAFGVERFPEIIFFRDGRPTQARQKGLTNPQGLRALYESIPRG